MSIAILVIVSDYDYDLCRQNIYAVQYVTSEFGLAPKWKKKETKSVTDNYQSFAQVSWRVNCFLILGELTWETTIKLMNFSAVSRFQAGIQLFS